MAEAWALATLGMGHRLGEAWLVRRERRKTSRSGGSPPRPLLFSDLIS